MHARFLLGILLSLALAACGSSDGGGGGGKNSYIGTQSPGDLWSFTLGGSTFDGTNETTGYSYSGSKADLANGFLKLIVEASTDPGVPLDGSATAYALEVPGVVLLVKPSGTDSKVIAAVGEGNCLPDGTVSANTVTIPKQGWDITVNEAYSRIDLTVSGSSIDIAINNFKIDGSSASSDNPGTLTCDKGVVSVPGGGTAVVTPAGVFVVDNGAGNGGLVGVSAPAAGITKAVLTAAGREFRGVLFKNDDNNEDDTQPVWVRTKTAGTSLKGGSWTDFEGNVEDTANTVTIAGFTEPAPGLFRATLTPSSSLNEFVMMVNEIGGKYMIFGIGENENSGKPFNVLLMER